MVSEDASQAQYDAAIRDTTFAERLRHGDTYGLVLGLIIVGYVFLGLLDDTKWVRPVMAVILGGTLLLALYASHIRGRLLRFAAVLVVIAFAIAIVQGATDSNLGIGLAGYATFGLVAVAPVVILMRIARHPDVDLETLLGAFCSYLLIAIVFAGIFRGFDDLGSEPFFAQTRDPTPVQFIYFSYTTLTTTGYGDLTPAHDGGRVVSNLEQLTGQIFLITIVSAIVTNFSRSRRARSGEP